MKAGKTAIATALGVDSGDLEQYQGVAGLFYMGDTYYTSRKVGSRKALPEGYTWTKVDNPYMERTYQIEVFEASSEV